MIKDLANLIFLLLFLIATFLLIIIFGSIKLCPLCPYTLASAITIASNVPGKLNASLKIFYYNLYIGKDHVVDTIVLSGTDPTLSLIKQAIRDIGIIVAAAVVTVLTGGLGLPLAMGIIMAGAVIGSAVAINMILDVGQMVYDVFFKEAWFWVYDSGNNTPLLVHPYLEKNPFQGYLSLAVRTLGFPHHCKAEKFLFGSKIYTDLPIDVTCGKKCHYINIEGERILINLDFPYKISCYMIHRFYSFLIDVKIKKDENRIELEFNGGR